jgi:hypothetical protein
MVTRYRQGLVLVVRREASRQGILKALVYIVNAAVLVLPAHAIRRAK